MQWLEKVVDEVAQRQPEGEILVSSGASPSGTYHFGHLREVIICDAIVLALRKQGREARHIHVVDDLDGFRKVPVTLPESYSAYLGMPLCEVPAPDGSARSYAQYCFDPFAESMRQLGIEFTAIYQHEKYRSGFYTRAIVCSLQRIDAAKNAIQNVSGRQLDAQWTPIQIMEHGRLKNRSHIGVDPALKVVTYVSDDGKEHTAQYDKGEVKLDWRLDWPARWWLLQVAVEPFGRDHATKGGSYDTGFEIAKEVYGIQAPIPVPYDFVNRTGDTKKMSASKGTGVAAHEITDILPSEVIRYFMLRYPPDKRLYFNETDCLVKLVDDYSELLSRQNKSSLDEEILYLCGGHTAQRSVSSIPFLHLVTAYQASLGNIDTALQAIGRTEYAIIAQNEADVIRREFEFIFRWLEKWAPQESKFNLLETVDPTDFTPQELAYLNKLGDEIQSAPADADGQWFHEKVYAHKGTSGLSTKELFAVLYRVLIGKESGPRAGWFLSILPRDWLLKRLSLEK